MSAAGSPPNHKATDMQRIEKLENSLKAMAGQLTTLTGECIGLKKTIAALAMFIHLTHEDLLTAAEHAFSQVKDASEPDGTPRDMQPAALSTIASVIAQAGAAWPTLHPSHPDAP